MKKLWIWVCIAIGVIIFAGVGLFAINFMGNVEQVLESDEVVLVQAVKEEELSESILVTGKIVPEEEQKVFLDPEKGDIIEYNVEENAVVEAGEPLFSYDATKIQAEFNRAVRERDLIQNRANAEQNQINEMDKQIAEAKKNKEPQEVINELVSEKNQLALEYESTKAEIAGAQEQINALDAEKKELTVKSNIDGIIVKINKNVSKAEDGSSEPVIHIISNQPYKVIGTMSEFDAVKIEPDQPVIVRPKVYKDREWNGVVESVSQFPNDDEGGEDFYGGGGGNVTMYPFKVEITDDTSELRQGFHVSLEVKLGEENALAVPHSAVMYEEDIEVVYVLQDNVLEWREVQTGKAGDEFIEITEGVGKGELVVVFPHEGMFGGMEVSSYDEID